MGPQHPAPPGRAPHLSTRAQPGGAPAMLPTRALASLLPLVRLSLQLSVFCFLLFVSGVCSLLSALCFLLSAFCSLLSACACCMLHSATLTSALCFLRSALYSPPFSFLFARGSLLGCQLLPDYCGPSLLSFRHTTHILLPLLAPAPTGRWSSDGLPAAPFCALVAGSATRFHSHTGRPSRSHHPRLPTHTHTSSFLFLPEAIRWGVNCSRTAAGLSLHPPLSLPPSPSSHTRS